MESRKTRRTDDIGGALARARFLIVSALLAVLCAPTESRAVLAEEQASVATVVDAFSATRHDVEARGGLTAHVIQASGLEVREYVAKSTGQVIGVAWNGSREPRRVDALLGSLMSEYVRGVREAQAPSLGGAPSIRGPMLRARSEHLVIERFGRMGVSRARIYLIDLPEGVSANEIR